MVILCNGGFMRREKSKNNQVDHRNDDVGLNTGHGLSSPIRPIYAQAGIPPGMPSNPERPSSGMNGFTEY